MDITKRWSPGHLSEGDEGTVRLPVSACAPGPSAP
jgi:hypothetical protein